MDKLKKKMKRLEKEFNKNPLATLENAKIMKKTLKLQAKIDQRNEKYSSWM